MEHFSNGAFLKWSNSQMERFSNGAILKWSDSQMEQFSNGAIWGRHPMPYFKIPRTEKYGMRCAITALACGRRLGKEHHIFLQDFSLHFSSGFNINTLKFRLLPFLRQNWTTIAQGWLLDKEWAFILTSCELPSRWLKTNAWVFGEINKNIQLKALSYHYAWIIGSFQTPQKLSGEDKKTEKRVADWFFSSPKQTVDFRPPTPWSPPEQLKIVVCDRKSEQII